MRRPAGAYVAGRWGSCWPGNAACPRRCCTGRGGGRAGSGCPGRPRDTPHTRHCYRSPRPPPPGRGGGRWANEGRYRLSTQGSLPAGLGRATGTAPQVHGHRTLWFTKCGHRPGFTNSGNCSLELILRSSGLARSGHLSRGAEETTQEEEGFNAQYPESPASKPGARGLHFQSHQSTVIWNEEQENALPGPGCVQSLAPDTPRPRLS